MPAFSWVGRTREGHQISGDLEASSKEEALRLLQAQRIAVNTISEHESRGAEPPDPDRAIRRSGAPPDPDRAMRGPNEPAKATPFRGLFVSAIFLVAAFGVGAIFPVLVVDCERTPAGAVHCAIHERIWGVASLRDQSLRNVSGVSSEEESSSTDSNTRRTYTTTRDRIILSGAGGASIRPSHWSGERVIGASNADLQSAVRELIDGSVPDRMSSWQLGFMPLIVSGILVLIAILGGALSLLAFSSRFTERFAARLNAASGNARRRRSTRE